MSGRRTRWARWPGITVLVAAALSLGVAAKRSGARPAPLDPSLIVTLERAPLAVDILETGRIQPRERVELKSKVAGLVTDVRVREGDRVKKGDLLLVLDPTDYGRDVARAEAEVARAEDALAFSSLLLETAQRGARENVVSAMEVVAKQHDVLSSRAALRSATVALATAQDKVRYTRLVSPIDGTVIARGIEPGEMVVPGVQSTFDGKALLTIADLSTLVVKVNLNQIDVAKVAVGQKATLTLDALPGRVFEAVLTKVAPASVRPKDKDLEVFPVEAQLTRSDGAVKPGMSADVRVHLETRADVLSVPVEAVVKEGGKAFVMRVLADGRGADGAVKTERVPVTTGAQSDRAVALESGVEPGQRILVKPASSSDNELKL